MSESRRTHVLNLLHKAATAEDPWARHKIHEIPAERVIRHLYHPRTGTWSTDETIVKMEKEPFTHGAMRYCYRLKKRAQPPNSATNRHFHSMSWSKASNYVAKAYRTPEGEVDCSLEAKRAVQNDILLQYEAQHWAEQFNHSDPPTKIHFIRAYALEFPDRPGQPWFAVERFIAGKDFYGGGFVKHNTNAGYVDVDERRITPQVFSAFSFYSSQGNRLVADIQGVSDLYTDPQVLSQDYRFGDGDLGPRGMALFFKSFRHCSISDALGIPIFALSRNELKVQAKYEEDEETLSEDGDKAVDRFQKLDLNRIRRSSALLTPMDAIPLTRQDTFRRSNISNRNDVRQSLRRSFAKMTKPSMHRTKSEVNELETCLVRATQDLEFTMRDFHRLESGQLKPRSYKQTESEEFRKASVVRTVSKPMLPTDSTRENLSKVHYQLAVLHGLGRFPDIAPDHDSHSHDAFSVLFHLSYAAALHHPPACLALGRVQAGLPTVVSELLPSIVPTYFDRAKVLLRRAMDSPQTPTQPKAAAGCLLYQILQDESHLEENTPPEPKVMMELLEETLRLWSIAEGENMEAEVHRSKPAKQDTAFHIGDRVEADYMLEGSYHSGTVVDLADDKVTVEYDDDGSQEQLDRHHVRMLIPPTATQTTTGGPLSDAKLFAHADDKFLLPKYELEAELAALKVRMGNNVAAAELYERAADAAVADGKMKSATEWSLKAASLQE